MLPIDLFKETLAQELKKSYPKTISSQKQSSIKDEEYEPTVISQNENHLKRIERLVKDSSKAYKERINTCNQYGIGELEFLALYILESEQCCLIQEAAYHPELGNRISNILIKALDSAVAKVPAQPILSYLERKVMIMKFTKWVVSFVKRDSLQPLATILKTVTLFGILLRQKQSSPKLMKSTKF